MKISGITILIPHNSKERLEPWEEILLIILSLCMLSSAILIMLLSALGLLLC